MEFWDFERNTLLPEDVSFGSSVKVYWTCNAQHSYMKSPKERIRSGCSICSNRKILANENSIAATHPELLDTFDFDVRENPRLETISVGTNKVVHWKCPNGHKTRATPRQWLATVCAVCSNKRAEAGVNDISTTNPGLAAQFDVEKNSPLAVTELTEGSNQMVWWICAKGHSSQATPNDRRNHRCGVCAGKVVIPGVNDLGTLMPEVTSEWHPKKNWDVSPDMVHPGSHEKFWWLCSEGHEWQASPGARQDNGCPSCASYGFKASEPAHLYLLHHPSLEAVKVGITGHRTKRISKFEAAGWIVLTKVLFEVGADARVVEKELHEEFRDKGLIPRYVGKSELGGMTGETEVFGLVNLTVEDVFRRFQQKLS